MTNWGLIICYLEMVFFTTNGINIEGPHHKLSHFTKRLGRNSISTLKSRDFHRTASGKFILSTMKVICHRRLVQIKTGIPALIYELSINFSTF